MRTFDYINNEYFNWLYNLACGNRFSDNISYRKLFMQLHDTEFLYIIPRDENRAKDGVCLRHRFADENMDIAEEYLIEPCSVLEMMLALAIRCETIMDDTSYGDRTTQWFWGMITNLGLGSMTDDNYSEKYVSHVLERFLNRHYEIDGKGGLFRVRNCREDLRDIEIWVQMLWYLDSIS